MTRALLLLPLLAACTVPVRDGGGPSPLQSILGTPEAAAAPPAPLPPQVLAALPPGVPASVVTRNADGCYLVTLERTNPPAGYPLRDPLGNRVCDGTPVAVAAPVAPLAPAPTVVTAPLTSAAPFPAPAGALGAPGGPPVPTAVLGAPPPPGAAPTAPLAPAGVTPLAPGGITPPAPIVQPNAT